MKGSCESHPLGPSPAAYSRSEPSSGISSRRVSRRRIRRHRRRSAAVRRLTQRCLPLRPRLSGDWRGKRESLCPSLPGPDPEAASCQPMSIARVLRHHRVPLARGFARRCSSKPLAAQSSRQWQPVRRQRSPAPARGESLSSWGSTGLDCPAPVLAGEFVRATFELLLREVLARDVPLLRSLRRSSASSKPTPPPHCLSQSGQAVARPALVNDFLSRVVVESSRSAWSPVASRRFPSR